MRSVLYLFNGTGWGDHFLAIPFIRHHIAKYGNDSLLVITYKKHIECLFNNINSSYIGLDNPNFCFPLIEKEIQQFGAARIICFNAFNGFDFDCHIQQLYPKLQYFGTYTKEGHSIRHSYKDYAHTRDQYFLLPGEDLNYTLKDRQLIFEEEEEIKFKGHFKSIIDDYHPDNTIIIHLETEQRKLWDPKSWYLTFRKLLDKKQKIILIGSNLEMMYTYKKFLPELFCVEDPDIRKVFWLLKSYNFFIGIDSIFAHVADAYDKTGIILFSDYPQHEWEPVSDNLSLLTPPKGKMTRDIPYLSMSELLDIKFL